MDSNIVIVEKENQFATVILNRPEKRNAINLEMFKAIQNIFTELKDDDKTRVVFVKGQNNLFSAGIDLFEFTQVIQNENLTNIRKFAELLQNSFNAIESLEKPVIALIEGFCLGAGLELALACDFRIMVENAKIGSLETSIGIIPDLGGTTRLVRALGTSVARKIIILGEQYTAKEAKELKLIDWVISQDELELQAYHVAQQLLKNAPLAIGLAKRLIDQVYGQDLQSSLMLEKITQFELLKSKDAAEAVMAKIENRKAKFDNR